MVINKSLIRYGYLEQMKQFGTNPNIISLYDHLTDHDTLQVIMMTILKLASTLEITDNVEKNQKFSEDLLDLTVSYALYSNPERCKQFKEAVANGQLDKAQFIWDNAQLELITSNRKTRKAMGGYDSLVFLMSGGQEYEKGETRGAED